MTSSLIQRATIDDVERRRNHALDLHAAAFDALAGAFEAGAAAVSAYSGHGAKAAAERLGERNDRMPHSADPRAWYLDKVRKDTDRAVWTHLIDFMGLERIMDRTARDQFREQLREDPPEATADNCYATFTALIGDANLIFQRGVALAFSGLDRRFRSHDGFKIGSRIVLSNAINDWGSWARSQDEVLRDVERAFYSLDGGKPQPERAGGIIGTWDLERSRAPGRGLERKAFEAEDEYFLIRSFKNGNVHLWFKRKDLVTKVNLLLAEYYGAGLGVGPDSAEPQHRNAVGPAKNFGLFETPEKIALRLLSDAGVYTPETYSGRGYPKLRVLEPSAGRGRIAIPAHKAGHSVVCIEVQPELARDLRITGLPIVNCADFLEVRSGSQWFDAVVMNPPFDRGRDVDHVLHALKFLKPGGKLAAIMAAGVEYREDRQTVAFRTLVERMGGRFRDLPPGSFAESGTNVNTVILTLTQGGG